MFKPYRPWVAAVATATLLTCFSAPPVFAETIVVGDQVAVRQTEVPQPKRGISMAAVQKQFGEPRERHPTVGTPPITRWDYDNFAVFFEKDLVIDSVVPGAPGSSTPADPATTPVAAPESAPEVAPIPAAAPAAAPSVEAASAQPSEAAPASAPAPANANANAAAAPKADDSGKSPPPLSDVSLHP